MKPLSESDAALVSAAALVWVQSAVRDARAQAGLNEARPQETTKARRAAQLAFLHLVHHGNEAVNVEDLAPDKEPSEEPNPWRGGEKAGYDQQSQADIQRWLK